MVLKNPILYGGSEGTYEEICLHSQSLGEALLRSMNQAANRIVLVDGISGKEVNGNELKSLTVNLARYLQKQHQIKSGDVISICSENRIEFAVTVIGTLLLGATIAPINHSYIENEMSHAVNLSKPKVIFASPSNLNKITDVAVKHAFVEQVILYDYSSPDGNAEKLPANSSVSSFKKIIEPDNRSNVNDFRCEPQDMEKIVALILCSSGTTGLPKGVELTQFNMFVANAQVNVKGPKCLRAGEKVVLGNLPMFHAFGISVFVTEALNPLTKFVLIHRFSEEDFYRCIQTYKVTNAFLVPPIILLLAKSPLVEKYNLSSIQVITYGAAPMSKDVTLVAQKRTGIKLFLQGYGMTEGTYAFMLQDEDHQTEGSAGVLLKGIYGRVVDLDSGQCLGPNQKGELHFKGKNVMKGYKDNLKATSETIDDDGWIHSGDVGYYDENGEFYIVDRIKELIKYKGFQVPPAEIESLLLTHSKIKDAAVIGVPDEMCGAKAFAFIVKQPGAQLNENDVADFVAGRLSYAKHLHGGVKFIDEIPKNLSGKILRRVLRDMAKELKAKL